MLMNRKAKTVNVLEGPITESCAEFPARHVFIKCPECRRVIDEARLHTTSRSALVAANTFA